MLASAAATLHRSVAKKINRKRLSYRAAALEQCLMAPI